MTVWQPGMRCVCIDDSLWRGTTYPCSAPPAQGRVYTVSRVSICEGLAVLALEECPDSRLGIFWWERRFFRPLSENRLDSLRALLNPTPARQKERVS